MHKAALLHDIGKVGISSKILNKNSKLTNDEYNLIKEHPAKGAEILKPIGAYTNILPIVAQHHERFDGLGYPAGLTGKDMDTGAKILAVADAFDAIISDRPYRKGLDVPTAIELIKKEAGKQFDPITVDAFLDSFKHRLQRAA